MGTASTKLKKFLISGDEFAVLSILHKHPELINSLNPNESLNHDHNSALHFASLFAMKPLLRLFLLELDGTPFRTNSKKQTSLHLACQFPNSQFSSRSDSTSNVQGLTSSLTNYVLNRNRQNSMPCEAIQERRAYCVELILRWERPLASSDNFEATDPNLTDSVGRTALHYASATGLIKCVLILLKWGANPVPKDNNGETALDLALSSGFVDICVLLEQQMVFEKEMNFLNCKSRKQIVSSQFTNCESFKGLRQEDLQEAKTLIVAETADMLGLNCEDATSLLKAFDWSREQLIDEWINNRVNCCEKAGIDVPKDVSEVNDHRGHFQTQDSIFDHNQDANQDLNCGICFEPISESDLDQQSQLTISCGHRFCRTCWKSFLTTKIQDGEAAYLLCPQFNCNHLVPVTLIEQVASPLLTRRYFKLDLDAFVESNPSIKWCPAVDCDKAVRLTEDNLPKANNWSRPNHNQHQNNQQMAWTSLPAISIAVDCGSNHYFCWDCLKDAHAPVSCDLWKQWLAKVAEVRPKDAKLSKSQLEEAANCLWLVKHSKPCPKCSAPIQKLDGCNHMRCTRCHHDFCWVCLDPWKRHGSSTGGFFHCTRFDAAANVREARIETKKNAETSNRQMVQNEKFYRRYSNYVGHETSLKSELKAVTGSRDKERHLINVHRERMAKSPVDVEDIPVLEEPTIKDSFLSDAINEVVKSRRVLMGSCAYGYSFSESDYLITLIFEYMESNLDKTTNNLSLESRRPYLQASRRQLAEWTKELHKKRIEFLSAISRGLLPPGRHQQAQGHQGPVINSVSDIIDMVVDMYEDPGEFAEVITMLIKSGTWKSLVNHRNQISGHRSGLMSPNEDVSYWPEDIDHLELDQEQYSPEDPVELGFDSPLCSRIGCERRCPRKSKANRDSIDYCSTRCQRLADPVYIRDNVSRLLNNRRRAVSDSASTSEPSSSNYNPNQQSMSSRRNLRITVTNHDSITEDDMDSLYGGHGDPEEEDDDDGASVFDAVLGDLSSPPNSLKESSNLRAKPVNKTRSLPLP